MCALAYLIPYDYHFQGCDEGTSIVRDSSVCKFIQTWKSYVLTVSRQEASFVIHVLDPRMTWRSYQLSLFWRE